MYDIKKFLSYLSIFQLTVARRFNITLSIHQIELYFERDPLI